ncbi:hypothetical protein J5X84_02750 [Streptosporangiaceae bacterium NEAU-GS5]|nr:hypothetical protein [Streptosporangiaceae bacterium NEAU-GS5]
MTHDLTIEVPIPSWARPILRDRVRVLAVLMGLVSLGWQGYLLSRSYFHKDDFRIITWSAENGLDLDFLFRSNHGQLMPGGLGLTWLLTRLEPYNWNLHMGALLLMQGAAYVAVYVLLRRLFGARRAILLPFGLYVFAPVVITDLLWYSAGKSSVPVQLAMAGALAAHVSFLRSGRRRHAVAALAWIVFGLLFYLKVLLLPLVLAAVTILYGSLIAKPRFKVFAAWWYWLAQAALMGGYVALYTLLGIAKGSYVPIGTDHPIGPVAYTVRVLAENFVPSATGGPLRWQTGVGWANADPPALVVWAACVIALAAIVVSVRYRRHAARAWGLLLGWVIFVDAGLTWVARASEMSGWEPRYTADAFPLLAVCAGLAFLPLAGEAVPYRRQLPEPPVRGFAIGLVAGVFVIGSAASTVAYLPWLMVDDHVAYMANARAALRTAPPGTDIYPRPLPPAIQHEQPDRSELTSRALAPIAPPALAARMRDPRPSAHPVVVGDDGKLTPMTLFGGLLVSKTCYPSYAIPLKTAGGPDVFGAVNYEAAAAVVATATVGGERIKLPLTAGSGTIYFPIRHDTTSMAISAPGVSVCVNAVAAGAPVPVRR